MIERQVKDVDVDVNAMVYRCGIQSRKKKTPHPVEAEGGCRTPRFLVMNETFSPTVRYDTDRIVSRTSTRMIATSDSSGGDGWRSVACRTSTCYLRTQAIPVA